MQMLTNWSQLLETEKRKVYLSRMRKEEEARGKAKRNKEKVGPRLPV